MSLCTSELHAKRVEVLDELVSAVAPAPRRFNPASCEIKEFRVYVDFEMGIQKLPSASGCAVLGSDLARALKRSALPVVLEV